MFEITAYYIFSNAKHIAQEGDPLGDVGRQLKKGVLEILVLKLLSQETMYGYQLIQTLDQKSGGVFRTKEGTLYPVLYRLEDGGLIESYWEQDPDRRGVPRKFYRLTAQGQSELHQMRNELHSLIDSIRAFFSEEGL